MRRLVVLAATLLASAACGDGRQPLGPTTPLTYSPIDSAQVNPSESQLSLAKARWSGERNAREYTFVTWYLCFCGADVEVPVRVTVHDAQVVSVREVTSGRSRQVADYYTIESLFDDAIAARARDVPVRVTYAGAGYPAWLTIGTPENDAGVTYHVEDVRVR